MNYETAKKKLAKRKYVMSDQLRNISVTHQDGSIFVLRYAHFVDLRDKNWLGIKTEHNGDFLFFVPDLVSYRVL